MRELKFRVWSNYWEKFATEAELHMDGSVDAMFEDDGGVPHHENTDLVVEFKTGLKDKNGKEIYEGDIVGFKWTKRLYVVTYRKYDASFILENDEWEETIHLSLEKDDFEAFGNIHENPKLLPELRQKLK